MRIKMPAVRIAQGKTKFPPKTHKIRHTAIPREIVEAVSADVERRRPCKQKFKNCARARGIT